jgi:peptidoglycan/xylan/chitin deacetylase (PgdA/CDA1 family)
VRRTARPTPSGEPVGHWTLTIVLLVTCALALCLQGYARRQLGHAGTQRSVRGEPARLNVAGSVIDFSGVPVAAEAQPRTVALTFDDGPDPRWTPAILNVLAKHRVVATFFVVGSRVAAHPELARSIQQAGHELGTHTFTHVDVTTLPWWQQRLQLSLTQTVMAGAVGTRPILFRPPYSSTLDALDTEDVTTYRRIAGQGYLIPLTDLDSEDWRKPGVEAVVANATPLDGKGAVVLFHDAGGDRQETVDALDLLITRLQAQNYSFQRVSDFAGLPTGAAAPVASDIQRWQGRILIWSLRLAGDLADGIGLLMIPLGLLAALRTVLLLSFARAHTRRPNRFLFNLDYEPSVTILVPAFNEAVGIETAVRSLSTCDYPNLRVIVIDDGSTDNTAAIVTAMGLSNVMLLRQRNGGKPAALNTGMRALEPGTEIVVTVDGDTVFERDALAGATLCRCNGGRRVGKHQGGQPRRAARPMAAHRVRDGVQP